MTRSVRDDADATAPWGASGSVHPHATPSWIAPHLDAQVVPRPYGSRSSAAPAAAGPTPSIRVVMPSPPPGRHASEPPAPTPAPYPDLREEVAALRRELDGQARATAEVRRAVLEASESELVRLACAVAERIARRELTTDPGLVIAWAREAIDALSTSDEVRLVVAPDLAALLDTATLRPALASLGGVEVDASVPAMSCEVRTRASRVEVGVSSRLATIADELGVVGG